MLSDSDADYLALYPVLLLVGEQNFTATGDQGEPLAARLLASVWRERAGYEEMLVGSGRTYRRVAQLSLEWIIDDGGKPLLLDVDTAGALASDELPLSKAYRENLKRLCDVVRTVKPLPPSIVAQQPVIEK